MIKIYAFILLIVPSVYSFSNVIISELLGLGYSHGGITERAIKRIAFEYLDVKNDIEFIEKLKFDQWLKHVSAVDMIEKSNDNVDNDPETKNRPMYHFDAERFVRGNTLLLNSQELILNLIKNEQYIDAREQLGKYLHTHQDFYSHSNWIEMGENTTYDRLGEIDAFNGNVATINMSTCSNCTKACEKCYYECVNNIVPLINQEKIFTSGYFGGEIEDGQPVLKPDHVLKCSHGGIEDTTENQPATGGINKDVKTPIYSSHYYNQEQAANIAIESSYLFLRKIWHLTEREHDNMTHFGRLLELVSCSQSLVFFIDLTNRSTDEIDRIKQIIMNFISQVLANRISLPCQLNIITSDKEIFTKPYFENKMDYLFDFINNLSTVDHIQLNFESIRRGLTLSNDYCFIYSFTNDLFYDNEHITIVKQKHCHLYFILSNNSVHVQERFETIGTELNILNENLASLTQVLKETLNMKLSPILIVNHVIELLKPYTFYIDNSVESIQFIIYLQSKYNNSMFDDKFQYLFLSPHGLVTTYSIYLRNNHIIIGKIDRPSIGQWIFRVNSTLIMSFQIKISTSVHLRHSFSISNSDSKHSSQYVFDYEPIQGDILYSFVRIFSYTSKAISFDQLEFLDSNNGLLIEKYNLIRQNQFTYFNEIRIPVKDFYIKVKGINDQNERLERLYPYKIKTRTIELKVHFHTNYSSYFLANQQANISFYLINHNSFDLPVEVKIQQRSSIFDVCPNKILYRLKANEMQTGYFELKASNNFSLSSHISIVAQHLPRSNAFNQYKFRAHILPLYNDTKPLICNSIFPSGKSPSEMCQGPFESCSSRYWNIYLNVTDSNSKSNRQIGIHSIVLSYYDSEDLLQSNIKGKIKIFMNKHINHSNLQLYLSPNDCCRKYADITAYDHNGHKTACMKFRKILTS